MIAYRIEVWCTGCGIHFGRGYPYQSIEEAVAHVANLEECATADGWVKHDSAHWCPQCQIKQASGPVIDGLALVSSRTEAR
jgi:hypothetical protein